MKAFKRIISILLAAVLLICSLSLSAYAKSDDSEKIVANVYICCRVQKSVFKGHEWLYFENLTNHDLKVGAYTMPKGQGVSVGTYSNRKLPSGFGIYYNVEAYRYNAAELTDNVYLKKTLTQKQFDRMSNKVARSNYWTHLTNCAFFAVTTWNTVLGKFLPYLMIPILTRLSVVMYPSHQEGLKMYFPTKDQIFKQKGFGSRATLVPTEPYK